MKDRDKRVDHQYFMESYQFQLVSANDNMVWAHTKSKNTYYYQVKNRQEQTGWFSTIHYLGTITPEVGHGSKLHLLANETC